MKKLLALLLALCMLLSLAACSETERKEEQEQEHEVEFEESDEEKSLSFIDPGALSSGKGGEESAEEEAPAEEPAEEEEPADEPAEEAEPAPSAPASGVPSVPAFEPSGEVPASFAETVLRDDEYCTVTLKDYIPDGYRGAELEVELVNKTENEVMFAARETAVNGIMLDPVWACSVEAGETETSFITFDGDDMDYSGINYLQEVLLGFDVYNNEDWQADHYFTDSFTIMLPVEGEGEPNSPVTADFPGYTVVDDENVTIAIVDYTENGEWGPELKVLLRNKTNEEVAFYQNGCALNGVMIYATFGENMLPGTVAYAKLRWDAEDLEACGIHYPKDVRVIFDVYSAEDYDELFFGEYAFTLEGGSGPAVEEVYYDGFEEVVLVEENGISIVAKNFDMEGYWGPTLTLYLQNETDAEVWVDLETVWVNGVELDPYWSTTLLDGTVRYSEVYWYEDDFAEAGITAVETIKLSFAVESEESWETLYEGDVTLFLN